MIADEIIVNMEAICQIFHEVLWKRSVKISSYTNSRMRRTNGNSHHAKTSFIPVKTIPVFLIALSLS
jgi:hypothetical protein